MIQRSDGRPLSQFFYKRRHHENGGEFTSTRFREVNDGVILNLFFFGDLVLLLLKCLPQANDTFSITRLLSFPFAAFLQSIDF